MAMTATRPDWRVHLKAGDMVSISATYDVRKASWYESMGHPPARVCNADDDPLAKDPFEDAAAVEGDVRRRAASSPTAGCRRTSTPRPTRT